MSTISRLQSISYHCPIAVLYNKPSPSAHQDFCRFEGTSSFPVVVPFVPEPEIRGLSKVWTLDMIPSQKIVLQVDAQDNISSFLSVTGEGCHLLI